MRRTSVLLAPLAAAALLFAGCAPQTSENNADDFQGVEQDVADAFFDFRDAVVKRDEKKVCDSYFTPELRDEIVRLAKEAGRGSTCADAISDSIQDINATEIEIEDITVSDTTAMVRIKTDLTEDDPVDTLELANDRGWRISKLPGS